jgi:taurine dioxygenase
MQFTVREVVPGFVGEINDFPFQAADAQVLAELRAAWARYPVMRFRNVSIDDQQQVAFSKALGPPVIHPRQLQEGKHVGMPEILVVSNKKNADGSPAGDLGDGELVWHTDTWFVERPPSAAILRALVLPPSGGNTEFANMYAAYETLPDELRQRVLGLTVHHQSVIDGRGDVRAGMQMPATSDYASWPGVDHPLVRRHGDSRKPCLYLGGDSKRAAIVGMPQDEAADLLAQLWRHATQPANCWAQEWRSGDMIMWDNRCVMHRRDAFDPAAIRLMHRTLVQGERPQPAH